MARVIAFLLILFTLNVSANKAQPINDEKENAINITNLDGFCSADQAYSNIEATSSLYGASGNWNGTIGKDVWFKFTALKFDVAITASGRVNATSPNTLINPLVALYTVDPTSNNFIELPSNMLSSNNVTSLNKGGLTIGQVYYIRISAFNNNEGSFKLCVDNYFPPLQPGQDCGTISILCSMEKFTQLNVTGAGLNNKETAGSCLETESNSAWYMWTAAKSGPFTFLITPTVTTNDIDWVLYDLGPGGTCAQVNSTNAIRCAVGSGVGPECNPSYFVTGLSMTETDLTEEPGCPINRVQNGLLRYVDLIAGHNYALLVDNFSGGNNGFTMEFGGGKDLFTGPTSEIKMEKIDACMPTQNYNFTSLATNYHSLKWTFGEGASIATSNVEGPINITYSTPGDKVVVLEAKTTTGCNVVSTVSFTVALKPATPTTSYNSTKLCPGNTVTLQTASVPNVTYHWTGPNGFASEEQNPTITITGPENAGDYQLYIQIADCKSDVATLTLPPIDARPLPTFSVVTNNACENNVSFTFINTSNYTDAVWDFGAGVNNVSNTSNGDKIVTYLTSGIKEIKLSIKSPTGCDASIIQSFRVQLKPLTPTVSSNTVKYCPGNDVTLSTPAVANATYHWSGPNGFSSTDQNPNVIITGPENSGDYQLIIEVGGCESDPALIKLPDIDLKPTALYSLVTNNKCLPNQHFAFTNLSKNIDRFEWHFGEGAIEKISANGDAIVTYSTNGMKTIVLKVWSPSGCEDIKTTTIEVQLKPKTPRIEINQEKFCLGEIIKMGIEPIDGVTYQWTGPNNFTANTPSFEIPITDFNQAGSYQIVMTIGECSSDPVRITIPPIARVPIAAFTVDPTYNGKYIVPLPINFTNKSLYADSYLWEFGDGTSSTLENPKHTFIQPGTYKIKLTAFADEGCSNTIDIGDLIIKNVSLFIPNTFTPNNDGINDEFVVTVSNLIKYRISIFNRVGENVFQSTDIFDNWKGTYRNQPVPVGVYYYIIQGTHLTNVAVKHSGSLTLIR